MFFFVNLSFDTEAWWRGHWRWGNHRCLDKSLKHDILMRGHGQGTKPVESQHLRQKARRVHTEKREGVSVKKAGVRISKCIKCLVLQKGQVKFLLTIH